MHVARLERRHGGRVYTYWLVRRSAREGKGVRHETIANVSRLPAPALEALRRALAGDDVASRLLVDVDERDLVLRGAQRAAATGLATLTSADAHRLSRAPTPSAPDRVPDGCASGRQEAVVIGQAPRSRSGLLVSDDQGRVFEVQVCVPAESVRTMSRRYVPAAVRGPRSDNPWKFPAAE